jgi:hypothetical protein
MAVIVGQNSPADDNPPGVPLIGYHNIVTSANITSTTAVTGFPISNVANPATHLFWRGGVTTGDELLTITTGFAGPIDYVGIAGHNLGSAQIPVTITDTGSSPPAILVSETLLPDDAPAILRFAPGVYSAIQIRLNLSFLAEGTAPQIAVIYLGKLLILERGIKVDVEHVPITFGRRTSIVNGMSETGNFLGRIVLSEHRESRAEFFGFTPDFYRSQIDVFLDAAQEFPFFWAWAPAEYPLETGFVWLLANAEPGVSPDHRRISLVLEMAGIA